MSGRRPLRWAEWLVRIAAFIVPGHRRDDWRMEWRAEIAAWSASGRSPLGPAYGVFGHALSLRWRALVGWVVRFGGELRFSVRSLGRRPLFAFAAIVTLGLGIGATTAVYSVVDAVLLAPLPYPGGDRLVRVTARFDELPELPLTVELLTEWRDGAQSIEAMGGYTTGTMGLVGAGPPSVVRRARVTPGFLDDLLGIDLIVGNHLLDYDDPEASEQIVLLSESLWRTRFDGSPDIVGRTVRLDGVAHEIGGVVPTVDLLPNVEVWIPHPAPAVYESLRLGGLRALARTAPELPLDAVLADLSISAERAGERYPDGLRGFGPVLVPYRNALVEDVSGHLLLLLGAVGAVLLIACTNVTNLMLARGMERRQVRDVRRSLGATPGQLATQVGAEALTLALVGGVVGIAIAYVSVPWLLSLMPSEIPLSSAVSVDARVLAFTSIVTLGTTGLVALLPSLRAARSDTVATGRAGGSIGRRERRSGRVLLGLEVTQACVLLVAAGLMMNTLVRMSAADSGFDPEGLVFAQLELPGYAYGEDGGAARAVFLERLRTEVSAVPAVRTIAVSTESPFSDPTYIGPVELEGGLREGSTYGGIEIVASEGSNQVYFSRLHIDAEYLGSLGLEVIQGRGFEPGDHAPNSNVAWINRIAAEAYWPDEDPIGRRLNEAGGDTRVRTIVGVVEGLTHPGLPLSRVAKLYLPLEPGLTPSTVRPALLIRHSGDERAVIEGVRQAIWTLDPELPIPAIGTAADELGAGLATPRFYTVLLSIFAGIALFLTAVGIYAVMGHSVARRTREMGIRLALGAPRSSVGTMVLREGMGVVAVGLVAGLLAAGLVSRVLESLLYEVTPLDPMTYGSVGVVLTASAALATWLPVRRAMSADPIQALREE